MLLLSAFVLLCANWELGRPTQDVAAVQSWRKFCMFFLCLYNEETHVSVRDWNHLETQRKPPPPPSPFFLFVNYVGSVCFSRALCKRLNQILFMAELTPEHYDPPKVSALSIYVPKIAHRSCLSRRKVG